MLPTQLQIGNTNGKKQKSNAIIRSPRNGTENIADPKISPIFQENKRGLVQAQKERNRFYFGNLRPKRKIRLQSCVEKTQRGTNPLLIQI